MTSSFTEAPVFPNARNGTYVFLVSAYALPELSPTTPNERPLPLGRADTITHLVTFTD